MESLLMEQETPANVGYSYSTKTTKAPGDDRISADNLHALLNFLRKFPTYYGRDTYLAGESYAGIYLPLLALKMLKHGTGLNIKDTYINTEIYPYVNFFNMHTSCVNEAAEPSIFAESPATKYLSRQSGRSCKAMRKENHAPLSRAIFRVASGTTACVSNSNLNSYLNTPAVRDALHISGRFEGRWEECKQDMYTMYRFDYLSTLNQYRQLLENNIPIAFLSGNLDVTSTHTGTGWFVDNLQLQAVTPKSAWFYSDRRKRCQLGGFYAKLRLNDTPLWYVVVHAAGHMIPSDQPGAALHLIRAFIQSDSPFD
ncbi:unnamed protein product [Dicrocoelium dendriticum]|nr:unnamed protein product [Dicrocoelium dendriticum]